MPNVSEAQRKAMAAAASGHSSLGISKKVGREFMAEDKGGKLPERAKKKKKWMKPGAKKPEDKKAGRAERWYGSKKD